MGVDGAAAGGAGAVGHGRPCPPLSARRWRHAALGQHRSASVRTELSGGLRLVLDIIGSLLRDPVNSDDLCPASEASTWVAGRPYSGVMGNLWVSHNRTGVRAGHGIRGHPK